MLHFEKLPGCTVLCSAEICSDWTPSLHWLQQSTWREASEGKRESDSVGLRQTEDRREMKKKEKKLGGERRSTAGILFDSQWVVSSFRSIPFNKASVMRRFRDTPIYTAKLSLHIQCAKKLRSMRNSISISSQHDWKSRGITGQTKSSYQIWGH